jgi:pimeloyl-ACP methyl ester carboxylesterase
MRNAAHEGAMAIEAAMLTHAITATHPASLSRRRLSTTARLHASASEAPTLGRVATLAACDLAVADRVCDIDRVATFCLIHGQWHDGSCWDRVAVALRGRGHAVVTPDMPFDEPRASYAERARPAIEALDGVDGPIVVVGHSNASPEAALVAARCDAALLVHLCPRFGTFATPPDAPPVFRDGFPFPPRDALGRGVWDPEVAIEAMYPRLPPATARSLAERLRPGASAVGDYPLPGHPGLPSAVVWATEDEFFTPEWQKYVGITLLGVTPIEIPGGHFPMVEDPDALAALLDRLGGG